VLLCKVDFDTRIGTWLEKCGLVEDVI